jgi:hypothetical protein
MNGVATVSRLTTVLAAIAAFTCATGIATARDTTQGLRIGLSVAVVSNGVVTYKIPNGPDGLEVSANAPGTITVTSGSNSVTVRGPTLTLSGGVVLAPFPTPGVRVSQNTEGGYTAVLDTPLGDLPDTDIADEKGIGSQLAQDLADADFGDAQKTSGQPPACGVRAPVTAAGRCVAPFAETSAAH